MPGEAQLIHMAESEKDVYVAESTLPRGDAGRFSGKTRYGLTGSVASVGRGFVRDSSDSAWPLYASVLLWAAHKRIL
jgi:hypothetical protein